MTEIYNNGTHYTLTPTDEEIKIETGSGPSTDEPLGSKQNPISIDAIPTSVTFTSDTVNLVYYSFIAAENGTVTITWPSVDSWVNYFEIDSNGQSTANSGGASKTSDVSFEITAGNSYVFGVGTWEKSGEVTLTITLS